MFTIFCWLHANRLTNSMNLRHQCLCLYTSVLVFTIFWIHVNRLMISDNESDTPVLEFICFLLVSCKQFDQLNEFETPVLVFIYTSVLVFDFFLVGLMQAGWSKQWIWHTGVSVYTVFFCWLFILFWLVSCNLFDQTNESDTPMLMVIFIFWLVSCKLVDQTFLFFGWCHASGLIKAMILTHRR